MNREDIIRMAREAGVNLKDTPEKASGVGNAIVSYYDLKRFAAIVAAAEREAIAQSLDKQADLAGDPMDREWAQEMAAAVRARSTHD